MNRSGDPREGDRVIINDEVFEDATGMVRRVYKNLTISVVLDEDKLTEEQKSELLRSPFTNKFHWVVEVGSYEIFSRRIIL